MIEYLKARMALDLHFISDYWIFYVLFFIAACGFAIYIHMKD